MATPGEIQEVEIFGLHGNNNGRSCARHAVCGVHVSEGDVLRMKEAAGTINGVARTVQTGDRRYVRVVMHARQNITR